MEEEEEDLADVLVRRGAWKRIEKIKALLDACDRTTTFRLFNASTVVRLERRSGLVVLAKEALYIVEGYELRLVPASSRSVDGENKNILKSASNGSSSSSNSSVSMVTEIVPTAANQADGFSLLNKKGGGQDNGLTEESLASGPQTTVRVRYEDIRELYKRRYVFRETGLEFFLVDGSSFLLVFDVQGDRDWLYSSIWQQASLPAAFFGGGSNHNRAPSASTVPTNAASQAPLRKIDVGTPTMSNSQGGDVFSSLPSNWKKLRDRATKDWVAGRISNFAYLMQLNTIAGRSYNDITQYPVFPWVLRDYTSAELDLSNPKSFRDLSKPMGAQTEERARYIQDRYTSLESSQDEIPFHYGTHYSCSAYVLHYLVRVEPYSTAALELQGGNFDFPDRIFQSIDMTWKSASGEGSMNNEGSFNVQDVRELIPEFFYFPDFLVNSNQFDFGLTQAGEPVNDAILPPWAHNNPREFIRLHRRALESKYVSENLHNWIDLIFGYKQDKKAAVEALNLFHPLTYEGAINLDTIKDPTTKAAAEAQIHNFGQTPTRLFTRPHPKRNLPSLVVSATNSSTASTLVSGSSLGVGALGLGTSFASTFIRLTPPLVLPGHFGGGVRPHRFPLPYMEFEDSHMVPDLLKLVPIVDESTCAPFLGSGGSFPFAGGGPLNSSPSNSGTSSFGFDAIMGQNVFLPGVHQHSLHSPIHIREGLAAPSFLDLKNTVAPANGQNASSTTTTAEGNQEGKPNRGPFVIPERPPRQSWLSASAVQSPFGVSDLLIRSDKVTAVIGMGMKLASTARYLCYGGDDGSLVLRAIVNTTIQSAQDKILALFEGLHLGRISALRVIGEGEGASSQSTTMMIGGGSGGGGNTSGHAGGSTSTGSNYVLVSGGSDAVVSVWDLRRDVTSNWRLDQLCSLSGHTADITCIDANPLYGIIVSGSSDGTVIMWDLGKKIFLRKLFAGDPISSSRKRSGRRSTAAEDSEIINSQEIGAEEKNRQPIISVCINPETGDIYTVAGRVIRLYTINGVLLAETEILSSHLEMPTCAVATSCADYQAGIVLVTGHKRGQVACWDLIYPAGDGYPDISDSFDELASSTPGLTDPQKEFIPTTNSDEVVSPSINDKDFPPPAALEARQSMSGGDTPSPQRQPHSIQIALRAIFNEGHSHPITALCMAPDQRQFASGDASGKVVHWVSAETSLAQNALQSRS